MLDAPVREANPKPFGEEGLAMAATAKSAQITIRRKERKQGIISLRSLWITAVDLVAVIGEDIRYLEGWGKNAPETTLLRRYRRLESGEQEWISLDSADKILTGVGHHIWELPNEPVVCYRTGGPSWVAQREQSGRWRKS
jgi:hypothetical protein